jgi:hypothetical protein
MLSFTQVFCPATLQARAGFGGRVLREEVLEGYVGPHVVPEVGRVLVLGGIGIVAGRCSI